MTPRSAALTRPSRELSSESEKQTLTALQGRVANLKATSRRWSTEQDELGLTEFEGIQGSCATAATRWSASSTRTCPGCPRTTSAAILTPLMLMRRYEVEYRLTRADPIHSAFNQELANFEKAFAAIIAADIMKAQLTDQVKLYADAFQQWMESTGKIARGIAVISAETRQMLPARRRDHRGRRTARQRRPPTASRRRSSRPRC